jgi:hypothetical protein
MFQITFIRHLAEVNAMKPAKMKFKKEGYRENPRQILPTTPILIPQCAETRAAIP